MRKLKVGNYEFQVMRSDGLRPTWTLYYGEVVIGSTTNRKRLREMAQRYVMIYFYSDL